ncbi:MAG: NADH-quinone oxidoreductase subunit A [Ignavibacteria bacterium]|nr:NADH-quinone oxidoreductase subunit A [Ignavibacteria bacterium]
MLTEFGKVFIFFLLGIVLVGGALIASRLIGPRNPTTEKLLPYECGENPIGSPWVKFNIRFYVVALIFILFDVELVVLFPWAVVFERLGMYAYVAGALFIGILFLADFYLWAKGDLEWVRPQPRIPVLRDIVDAQPLRDVPPPVPAPAPQAAPVS